ncbi:hypothetical protein ACFYPZ_38670 [Streptomyces sp. NPDC005506]|uniref:hypothetical protein n=1 Tax=unclassified Streptomyces TaxID=2593676 RepID=UPI003682A272
MRSANRCGPIDHQKLPQILSAEVVEQAGEIWPGAAKAPGEQVFGGRPLRTLPQDDMTDV